MVAKKKQETGVISKPEQVKLTVRVRGISPLIHERFSSRAKGPMADKQAGKPSHGKVKRTQEVIEKEYQDSLYVYSRGKNGKPKQYGVKAIWFKAGMAYIAAQDRKKSDVHRQLRVGHTFEPEELLPIIMNGNGDPHMRIGEDGTPGDTVRNANGVADIRYRGEFSEWVVDVPITFNARRVSKEQVLAWLEEAGTGSGCGGWRPQKGGQCGMYEIEKVAE